jgi:hypothetical protein
VSFLVVAGFAFPVAAESFKRPARERIGALERMNDGSLSDTRRDKKRKLEFSLTPMTWAGALEAYEGLLDGDGHVWAFGATFGLYSYAGLGPNAGYVGITTGAGGKFSQKMTVGATTGTITFNPNLPSTRWTIMVWRFESGAWHHYVIDSTGAYWRDGVATSAPAWLSVPGDGTFTISNVTGAAVDYSDLVALPFIMPASWVATMYASTRAFSPLPKLEVYGTPLLGSAAAAPVMMMGEVGDADFVPSGTDKTVQKLSATLREV